MGTQPLQSVPKPRPPKIESTATLEYIPLGELEISELSQRPLRQHRVDHLVSHFDQDQIGTFQVSQRSGKNYVMDGQHRVFAAREVLPPETRMACWVWKNLTEEQEAERCLVYNDQLTMNAMDKFNIGVTAGRSAETAIAGIAEQLGLRVTYGSRTSGNIQAVTAVKRIYERDGGERLHATLSICLAAFGELGLTKEIIDGVGLVVGRYPEVDYAVLTERLTRLRGGVSSLLTMSNHKKLQYGGTRGNAVAAVVVEVYNKGKGKNLPVWYKTK